MDELRKAIEKVVKAPSQISRRRALKRVALLFYKICLEENLDKPAILSLAAEIVGCFTQDMQDLKKNQ